jgi:hypothetical protein
VIFWPHFFEIPNNPTPVNSARPIDGHLSDSLFHLPITILPKPEVEPDVEPDARRSLAARNLLRGKMLGLASGQQVAQMMGEEVLSNAQLDKHAPRLGNDPGWQGQAPLWFYILKEAQLQHSVHGRTRLGTVGGRIVAEVFVGLLERDKSSYLSVDPAFRPQPLVARESGVFGMGDLLKFAEVA